MTVEKIIDADGMGIWKFEDGIEVYEVDFDGDLHNFNVYNGDDFLGTVYPASVADMNTCIKDLNEGSNPIVDGWEDGNGNTCTLEGWGEE